MPETCETCRFWERVSYPFLKGQWKDYPAGKCHRNAPLVTGGLHCAVSTEWPIVAGPDYCGEHQEPTQ